MWTNSAMMLKIFRQKHINNDVIIVHMQVMTMILSWVNFHKITITINEKNDDSNSNEDVKVLIRER